MPDRSNMSQDDFERLLQWFGPDRDASAKKYVDSHERLTRFFHFKGCNRPEDLADEVMNRVASKPPTLRQGSDHIAVLLGFAYNVLREYWRERERSGEETDQAAPPGIDESTPNEMRAGCLDRCLAMLPEDEKQFLLEYHEYEPGAKIGHRKAMARGQRMTLNALRLKACRLKCAVGDCVERCCQSGAGAEVQ
jgi:DNA-directed RNA polymerase specialized sigma24 family protein